MFRHDNFPDINWRIVPTFPKHFHNGSQDAVEESDLTMTPLQPSGSLWILPEPICHRLANDIVISQ